MNWSSMKQDRWIGLALKTAFLFGAGWLLFGFATTNIYSVRIWAGHSYWPLIYFCGAVSLVGALLFCVVERSVSVLLVAGGIFALIAFGPQAVIATIALLWLAYLSGELVLRRKPEGDEEPTFFFVRIAIGLLILAVTLNIAIALPVHGVRTYTIAFFLAVFLRWQTSKAMILEISSLWSFCRVSLDFWSAIASVVVAVFVCVQIAEAAFPERQFDALALHMIVAQTVKSAGQWHFAGDFLSTAHMALAADWFFSVMFILAGEEGAKLVNYIFFLLAAVIVHTLSLQRFGRGPAIAATLVLLSSPLTFLEAAGVSLDNFLLMAITTTVAVCGLWQKLSSRERLLSSAVLLGGLPTAKLHGVFAAAALFLLLLTQCIWREVRAVDVRTIVLGLVILVLGASPFLIAFAVTGNPLFPFFNAIFASPYFLIWDFKSPFPPDIGPWIIHHLTFYTSKYIQGADGAFGFQFVVFALPSVLATLARPRFFSISCLFIILVYSVSVLLLTADARYIYPIFPLFSVTIAQSISLIQQLSRRTFAIACLGLAFVASCLNFLYFPGARWTLLPFNPLALFDSYEREKMIEQAVPQRLLNDYVNNTYGVRARIVYIGQPVGYPLLGTPIFPNWYMPNVWNGLKNAKTNDEIAQWLSSLGATHLIISTTEKTNNNDIIRRFLSSAGMPLMVLNGKALYMLPEDIRFGTVLSRVGSWGNWATGGSVISSAEVRIMPNTSISFSTPQLTMAQRQIRATAQIVCGDEYGEFIVQVNWHGAKDIRSMVAIKSFPCANNVEGRFSSVFDRPHDATNATISLTNRAASPAQVSELSVATTGITLAEPVPLFHRDWLASPMWPKLGYLWGLI